MEVSKADLKQAKVADHGEANDAARYERAQLDKELRVSYAALPTLPPDGVALLAEDVGVKKTQYDTVTILVLAILGGAFISIGGLFATVAQAGSAGMVAFGLAKVVGGFVFATGLILVVVAGAQLFTSDALMVMAWSSGRITGRAMMRVWVLVWLGNLVGALGTALIVFLSGQYMQGHGAVGEMALYYASSKATLPSDQAFFMGIMCNVLVCLGAWVGYAGRTVADKVLAIVFPIGAFVAAGFEHCVANMYFVPLGLFIKWWAPEKFWIDIKQAAPEIPVDHFIQNLGVVTLGNVVGGGICIGLMYWIAYRRPKQEQH
ncbi:formate/nitrite transporter family protein [Microvirga sp. W0021]|uniref:Formate/nitrite transporter family protein n=1 Tax=Hohaiivirga grylli TaxID=3133970 RepID=A0ABV0BFY6_9HYPH